MSPDDEAVLVRRQGRIGRITLNAPRTLNALDHGMVKAIGRTLDDWHDDPAVHLVVIEGSGDRAFCAGGDVRSLRTLILAGEFDRIDAFFVDEYRLNHTIARYPKPYVALIDGIWMGGGVGLSVHGGVRVVSEHASFAMPEAAVGLFPDVGASFVLPRVRGQFGRYLGLTGARVGAADACWLGLATHYVPRADLRTLADALAADGIGALTEVARPPGPGELAQLAAPIASVFGHQSLAAIRAALDEHTDAWASAARAAMDAASPSALRWAFDLLCRGAERTLEQCQQAELDAIRRAMRHPDFPEGVRAMLVDKDRQPRWSAVDPA